MRDYYDKQYRDFRKLVRSRDKYCKWPQCYCRKKLQVHHILPWAKYPLLRYVVTNGITLCKKHHAAIRGKEMDFATFLSGLINK